MFENLSDRTKMTLQIVLALTIVGAAIAILLSAGIMETRSESHLLTFEVIDLPDAETQTLAGLDKLLRAVFNPGAFIWEAHLAGSFPPTTFWYLYGSLREEIIEAAS